MTFESDEYHLLPIVILRSVFFTNCKYYFRLKSFVGELDFPRMTEWSMVCMYVRMYATNTSTLLIYIPMAQNKRLARHDRIGILLSILGILRISRKTNRFRVLKINTSLSLSRRIWFDLTWSNQIFNDLVSQCKCNTVRQYVYWIILAIILVKLVLIRVILYTMVYNGWMLRKVFHGN